MIPTETRARPDMDIDDDINAEVRSYSPLQVARHFFKVQSTNGNVKVSGNSGSLQAKRMLRAYIEKTQGVVNIDMSAFYDDETIRLNIAETVPEGIQVYVRFGSVLLDSILLNGNFEVLQRVRAMAGIQQVKLSYHGAEITG